MQHKHAICIDNLKTITSLNPDNRSNVIVDNTVRMSVHQTSDTRLSKCEMIRHILFTIIISPKIGMI